MSSPSVKQTDVTEENGPLDVTEEKKGSPSISCLPPPDPPCLGLEQGLGGQQEPRHWARPHSPQGPFPPTSSLQDLKAFIVSWLSLSSETLSQLARVAQLVMIET